MIHTIIVHILQHSNGSNNVLGATDDSQTSSVTCYDYLPKEPVFPMIINVLIVNRIDQINLVNKKQST